MRAVILKTFAVMALVFATAAGAQTTWKCGTIGDSTNVTATLSNGTLTVSGTGDMADYINPITMGNHAPWYSYRKNITSVIIENGVTYIGRHAFSEAFSDAIINDYSSLTSVTIPTSVTSIGNNAFWNCIGLTSVTIPNSVTTIGNNAFQNCRGLTSVEIPNSVTFLSGFSGCTNLTSVTIPTSVTSIGDSAFYYCRGITSMTIPNSVISIGDRAFYECSGITSMTIPTSVTSIGNYAFSGLTSITCLSAIPPTVDSNTFGGVSSSACLYVPAAAVVAYLRAGIGSFTCINGAQVWNCGYYYNTEGRASVKATLSNGTLIVVGAGSMDNYCCGSNEEAPWVNSTSSITRIEIDNGVTSIGLGAFSGCSGLTSVTIPNSVTSVGTYAFSGCRGLTSLTIPNSVTSIGAGAFSGCSGLTSVTIPNSVTSIGYGAFQSCIGLTSVTIPNSVTTIGNNAFQDCRGLTSVTIPNGVTSIGDSTFLGCTGLTSVTIGNGVTSVGRDAFWNCIGLTSMTIGNGLTSISGFDSYRLYPNLTKIDVGSGNTAYSSVDGVLFNKNKTMLVTYPKGKQGAYSIPNGVTSIGTNAFWDCIGLTSVTIPNSVTSIRSLAFNSCASLTSVTIPNSVTSIGGGAFYYCIGLTSIVVSTDNANYSSENGVLFNKNKTTLHTYPVGKQGASYTIPNSVTSIEENAFDGCTGLTSVTIPTSVTSIGGGAFQSCIGLTSVTIPTSVTSIGNNAFWYCIGLTSVTIPNSVTAIGGGAFSYCSGLTSVISLGEYPPNDAGYAFSGVSISSVCLYVPQPAISAYNTTDVWKDFNFSCAKPTHTVAFNSQDGSVVSSQSVGFLNCVIKPADPTRTGYVFGGWYTEAEYTNAWDFDTDVVESAVMLYAKWTPATYAVTYDLGGGTVSSANPASYTIEDATFALNNPTKTGYIFAGWTGANGTTAQTSVSVVHGSTGIRIYTANWTVNMYTVTFDSQNGNAVAPQNVPYGGKVMEPADPTLKSYNFDGWFQEPACVNAWDFGVDTVTSAIMLYAKWTKLEIHVVTFNSEGGSAVGSEHVEHGSKATMPATPIHTGYTFGGWYTESEYTNAWDFATAVTSAVTLYAKWTINEYTVTFFDYSGTQLSQQTVNHGSVATAPTSPTRTGYTFIGWDKAFNYVTGDLTVTAVYEINSYAVTFNSEGGSTVGMEHVEHGSRAAEPAAPTRVGYTFDGWYRDAQYANAWDFATAVTSAITLYAKWTANEYTVTFVDWNGTQLKRQTVNYGSGADAPALPTRTGYTFTGWDKAFDYIARDLTVTALYAVNTYAVTFNSQSGSAVASQTIPYGGKVTEPADPARSGYNFDGWFREAACVNLWGFGVDVVGAAVTLFAKWTTVEIHVVTFNSEGGNAVSSEHIEHGKKVAEPAAPTRAGYTFGGWYKEPECITPWDFAATAVTSAVTLYAKWTQSIAVLTPDRVVPQTKPNEEATVIAPITVLSGEFTAGPNPVAKQSGSVNFYRQGKRVAACELRIYDATGNVISKVKINDKALNSQARRQVGTWDLKDKNGRSVPEGTYLVRGVVKTSDGKSEKVSVILGVR